MTSRIFPARFGAPEFSRRALVFGAAALAAAPPVRAAGATRIAAIDWAMLETALALGVAPVAATELKLFREGAVDPPLPDGVVDLGLRGAIAYERLLEAAPDLILISPWYEDRRAALERIAPVESLTIFEAGRPPLAPAVEATRALGRRLGREPQAEAAIADAEADFARAAEALAAFRDRPFFVINIGDSRHFRAFGADSLFGDVLARLGLKSAWTTPTRFGAYPTVGVETLAAAPEAVVVNVGPTPPAALQAAETSPLWRAMPPVAAGRLVTLDPVNPYGALPAARRFARLLSEAMSARNA